MKIDLLYYTPYLNDYYFIYGPEKDSNGDIYIKGTGYYFADVNDMKAKLNSMTASLAPEITNVQARNQGNSFWIYVGDLNTSSSDVPDYTQVLTDINSNLTNLNNKFIDSNNSNIARNVKIIASGLSSNSSSPAEASETSFFRLPYNRSFLSISQLFNKFINIFLSTYTDLLAGDNIVRANSLIRFLSDISSKLKQSVSPNASITDVLSALNTTIDSKQDTTIVNNEVTPLAEINIDVPFEVKNLKKSDVENL